MEEAGPTFQIAIVDDEGQVTSVPLMRDEFTVGRKEGNVIRLTERNVSRNHARILRENSRFYLNDLSSYNGTRLNGRRIRGKMPLSPGDEIGIGDYTLKIEALAGAEGSTSVPPAEAAKAPQITVVVDGQPAAVHTLSDVPHVIGRGDEATIRLDDPKTSRVHARLHLLQGRYFVEDAGGVGGIRIGGHRVRSKALDPGDVVDIGHTRLYFTLGVLAPEDIKPAPVAAPRKPEGSRLPMIFGILGAVIAIAGVIYLLLGRKKSAPPAAPDAPSVAAVDAGSYGGPGPQDTAVAVVPAAADGAGPATTGEAEGPGPSADETLARAREAADGAAATTDWNAVLELLAAPELASDADAATLRASATRERDARQALDEASAVLAGGDAPGAASKLSAIPPDVRCAPDAVDVWEGVIGVGREAALQQKVEDLKGVVEALNAVMAPPPVVADGRSELAAALRRLEARSPPQADAGAPPPPPPHDAGVVRPPRDAGTVATSDARPRVDTAPPPRDTAEAAEAPTGNAAAEALSRARQMILDGDNAGCIDVLTHAPQTCRNIEVLVTCYKGEGRMPDAYTAMENYVRRCDGQRKYEEYLQILQGVGRAP